MARPKDMESLYISAACNRYPHSLDWGNRLIAYGACNSVSIYDTESTKVTELLLGHSGQVNCVRWIVPDRLLVSSSSDKTAIIWEAADTRSFHPKLKLVGHNGPVVVADTIVSTSGDLWTVTLSSDFSLRVWCKDLEVAAKKLKNYAFDAKVIENASFFVENSIVIAYSSGDEFVHFELLNTETNELTELMKLTGHEDWIRSIDFIFPNAKTLMIASGAQDNFIRVWKIERAANDAKTEVNEKMFDITGNGGTQRYVVKLETVLAAHEGWVYGVKWFKSHSPGQPMRLLSCSIDKSIVLWEEPADGEVDDIWIERARVGEVGGNSLGFLGCTFVNSATSDVTTFAAHSFNGAVHIWALDRETGRWDSSIGLGGHSDLVVDISWSHDGEYLLSTSYDETTRLHAPWSRKAESGTKVTWHEMARPQIHGYLINCLTSLNSISFATGADEKVVRIFKATQSFVDSWKNMSSTELKFEKSSAFEELPQGAAVPSLGLSNRAIFIEEKIDDATVLRPVTLTQPPTEEDLMQSTLWPEVQKLYGHGYEIYALASSSKGDLVASACKATKAEHAEVILWNATGNYAQLQTLPGHQLTVTAIKFSPNDKFIVTVSRDRTWTLFERSSIDGPYKKVAWSDKKNGIHARIIWDVAWSPDSDKFLTVSRDGKAVLWSTSKVAGDEVPQANESTSFVKPVSNSELDLIDCIMSCDIADRTVGGDLVVAFGLENGCVVLCKWSGGEAKWEQLTLVDNQLHHLMVRKVRWRPGKSVHCSNHFQLASCSDDRTMRITEFIL